MAKSDKYRQPKVIEPGVVNQVIDDEPSATERLHKVESWYQDRSGLINKALIGVLAVVAAYFAYTKLYKAPQIEKSNEAIFRAQSYFGMDSINFALNGDGNSMGFLKVIDKYGSTPAGNLAKYYAGICYLKKDDFKNAEKYLKDFDGKGTLVEQTANGALGDALMGLGKTDDAISAYKKASSDEENLLFAPIYMERMGMAYELKNNPEEAKKVYKDLRSKFPMSAQARNCEKHLARLGDLES